MKEIKPSRKESLFRNVKGEIDLSAMVTGLVLVLVLILIFSAFAGPISTAINGTYVGGGAASALWDGIVFLLIVLSVILAIVYWALSSVSKGRSP